MDGTCAYCRTSMIDADGFIGLDDMTGVAHVLCWHRAHSWHDKASFHEVLMQSDNQVLVRELLERFVSKDSQHLILEAFNAQMQITHHLRRLIASKKIVIDTDGV